MARTKRASRNQGQQVAAARPAPAEPVVKLVDVKRFKVVDEVKVVSPKPQEERKKKRSRGKKRKRSSYVRSIFRVLRQIYDDMNISKRAMEIVDSFMNDVFERIANEAAFLVRYNKRKTIMPLDVESATKLVLNGGELTKHAIHVGTSAVVRFFNSTFDK